MEQAAWNVPAGTRPLAQFFTPAPVARFMASWVASHPKMGRALDPAVGRGALVRALLERQPQWRISARDLDPHMLDAAATALSDGGDRITWSQADYLYSDWDEHFDVILCNPPYLHFRHFPQRHQALELCRQHLGFRLGGLSNIYTLFMLKSIYQLAPGGRAAYIVPAEFLNADYGTQVKRYLLDSGALRAVVLFDPSQRVFAGVSTTSCILLFAKDTSKDSAKDITKNTVSFVEVEHAGQLSELEPALKDQAQLSQVGRTYAANQLDPACKWSLYYREDLDPDWKNLAPFSQFGRVARGIATGANTFFLFDRDMQRRHHIPTQRLRPCIARSPQAPAPFFTQSHFRRLQRQNAKVMLLDAGTLKSPAVRAYINAGEEQGIHQRYLTSHRTPWYAIEKRTPAPIWLTTFNRNGLRCVRNEAGILALTTFHSAYLNPQYASRADAIHAFMLTKIARDLYAHQRRQYAGGLVKYEPNDLNRAQVADFSRLNANTEKAVLQAYSAYRSSQLRDEPGAEHLQRLEDIFFTFLGG